MLSFIIVLYLTQFNYLHWNWYKLKFNDALYWNIFPWFFLSHWLICMSLYVENSGNFKLVLLWVFLLVMNCGLHDTFLRCASLLVSRSPFIYLFVFWWYLILVVHIANNGNCRGGPFFRPKTNSGQCKFNHFPCNFPFYILLLWLILAIPGRLEWSWCTHQLQHQVHEKWWWNTCDKEGYWEAGSASQGAHCCLWRG